MSVKVRLKSGEQFTVNNVKSVYTSSTGFSIDYIESQYNQTVSMTLLYNGDKGIKDVFIDN